jgi:hypothetical protein
MAGEVLRTGRCNRAVFGGRDQSIGGSRFRFARTLRKRALFVQANMKMLAAEAVRVATPSAFLQNAFRQD